MTSGQFCLSNWYLVVFALYINVESDNTSYSTFSMLKKSMYGSQITCYLGLNLKNLSMGPFPSSEFLQR